MSPAPSSMALAGRDRGHVQRLTADASLGGDGSDGGAGDTANAPANGSTGGSTDVASGSAGGVTDPASSTAGSRSTAGPLNPGTSGHVGIGAAAPRRPAAIPRPPGAARSPGRRDHEDADPPTVTSVSTQAAADALAARLLAPGRQRPIVVITVPGGLREPRFDVGDLADALAGLAEVAVVRTESAAWRLSEKLPAARVYGGAGRAYPIGLGWTYDDSLAPLRLPFGEDDRTRATDAIRRDALSMATVSRDGTSFVLPAHARPARGVVKALFPPSRAMVTLADGSLATIWQELTATGVEIDRLLKVGQQVRGMWDREARRLDIREMLIPVAASVAEYEAGDVVLTQVTGVGTDVVQLALVPGIVVDVPRDNVTSNPLDSMTGLFTVGEAVLARIEAIDGTAFALRLDDIEDDEEALPAPPLIKGGLSWLVEPDRRALAAPEPGSPGGTSAAPAAGSGPSEERASNRRPTPLDLQRTSRGNRLGAADATELRAVQEHARALEAQVLELSAKVQNQRTIMRQDKLRYQALVRTRARAGEDGAGAGMAIDGPPAFSDPEEQFRFEVYVEWAARIPAVEKERRALPRFALSDHFLASIDTVEGVERSKVVQVAVELLTGLAEDLDSREVHQLRVAPAGGSGQLTREGGWGAWRASLKRKSPAAGRIHYWRRGPDFELGRVVTHDDMRI